jgi:iron complex transport system ATP-binding protein
LQAGGLAQARRLFAALDLQVEPGQRWVVIGAQRSRQVVAPRRLGRHLRGRSRQHPPRRHFARGVVDAGPGCRARLEPAVLVRPVPVDGARDRRARVPARPRLALPPRSCSRAAGAGGASIGSRSVRCSTSTCRVLSGGERQRVALATALLQEAPILLLDEPASHLDPAHQRLLLRVLREHAAAGGSVVASLHDLNLAWDLASHAVLIDGRGGACAGTRAQVFDAGRLGEVFGVTIEAVDVGGATRFLMADLPVS